MDIQAATQNRS